MSCSIKCELTRSVPDPTCKQLSTILSFNSTQGALEASENHENAAREKQLSIYEQLLSIFLEQNFTIFVAQRCS